MRDRNFSGVSQYSYGLTVRSFIGVTASLHFIARSAIGLDNGYSEYGKPTERGLMATSARGTSDHPLMISFAL